jgi:hypothetical protein
MVGRAIQRGSSAPSIAQTLGILSEVSAAKCFEAAVGPEVVERMKRSLRAGRKVLDHRKAPPADPACCG